MFEKDILIHWDQKVLTLEEETADPNIFDYDLALWLSLKKLCEEEPHQAIGQFGFDMSTVLFLRSANPERIKRLCSGIVLSFQLQTPEDIFLKCLNEPVESLNFGEGEGSFKLSYWSLLNRSVAEDIYIACEVFGISMQLAEIIGKATDLQLKAMSSKIETKFTLRFKETLIRDILRAEQSTLTLPMLKKFQQSLQRSSFR